MSELPLVSVVVISYNGSDVIRPCLDTLLASEYPRFELIVVDNGSTDTLAEIVEREYSSVRLVRLMPNRGYAGGMNEGLKAARGEVLVPFNDDTESTPGLIREMVQPLLENAGVGIVGCKILYPDRKTLQHAGGVILPNGLTRHFGYGEEDRGQYDEAGEVEYVTGCAIAVRRELFETLGLYDDRYYPTYYEEVEFCWRARRVGWRIAYAPKAVLYHLESKTEGALSPRMLYRYHKSRLRFALKNLPFRALPQAVKQEWQWLRTLDFKTYLAPLSRAYGSTLVRLPFILYDRNHRFLPLGAKPE